MRLAEEYKLITEQLSELYQYKEFVEERIITLEMKLKEVDTLIDFADNLNGGDAQTYSALEQINNELQKNLFESNEENNAIGSGKLHTNRYKIPSPKEYFKSTNSFISQIEDENDLQNNDLEEKNQKPENYKFDNLDNG